MISIYKNANKEALREIIGGELWERQRASRHLCLPIGEQGYYLAFCWCDIHDTHKGDERVCIYCGVEDLLLVSDSSHCCQLLRGLPPETPPAQALADFLLLLTADDVDVLERLETDINELEDGLITTNKPIKSASNRIVTLRRSLLKMKRYYDQLGLVVDELLANENQTLPSAQVARFAMLSRRLERLSGAVSHLGECLTQAREAYQAQVDIEQNQIMKIFTVITAVFLPLTLIVGWYGMNFHIPELSWRFGYLYVTVLSILVCISCILIFKRKKWF